MKKLKHNRLAVQLLTLAMLAAILSGFALTALATDDGTGPPAPAAQAEKTAAETAGEGTEASPEARKAPQRAGPSDAFGYVRFIFERDGYGSDQTVRLNGYQYITECRPGATVYTVEDEFARQGFITTGEYVAYMCGSNLHLKGNLNGACINLDGVIDSSPYVYVQEDTTIGGNHCLLYNFQGNVNLRIRPGKTLTLNAQSPGQFRYMGAIRANDGGDVSISGGGTLNINATGSTEAVDSRSFLSGIRGSNVTLENCTKTGFEGSPTVNILMDNRYSGPEGDKVIGISAGKLTVKDDTQLRINVYGRALNTSNDSNTGEGYYGGNGGRSNRAISASSMELLNNASLTIFSHKNVMSDICLGGSGEVLTVNTSGYLNIQNDGNIERYALDGTGANDAMLAMYRDYPTDNIYYSDKDATVNLVRAEKGVSIVSYSAAIDDWYDKYYIKGQEDANNWAISCRAADPTLGAGMHRGSLRIGDSVQLADNKWFRNHGSIEYIWAPQGVATVQQSKGLIMGWHAPEDNPQGSSLYYAKVLKPELNDIRVVRKGESLTLTAPTGKGKFLCWYDAQHPEGSGSGTSWTDTTQTFTNIQQDMVLVPVRDPMTTGPNLSAVGYVEQYDSDTSTYTNYAYQDLTFAKEDNISNGSGGYRVMLVPAQLPRYGENTYAAKDLKNRPVMGLRNSRLYADAKASFAYGTSLDWRSIPEGSYRIAYDDDETGRCYFSQPFTFDPPVAPPYIAPGSGISEDDNHVPETVTITVERNRHIEYRVWNSSTNKWSSLQRYTGPFAVDVSVSNDVRIEAYAGASILGIKSEAYYAVRPSGAPTVKYGSKVLSEDSAVRYFYGSIELTVEAPEGYEVWYREDWEPSESNMGTRAENGRAIITDSGNSGKVFFKLAKAFTVNGREYRKLSHNYAAVYLTKLNSLPVPNVTVRPKSGGEPLTPVGNTYTIREFVNVELTGTGSMPLNATMAYDRHGGATPNGATAYTTPFEVRGDSTVSVFTCVPNADGGYDYKGESYVFKVDPSVKKVLLVVRYATAYDSDGNELLNASTSGVNVSVGARIRVVPIVPTGKVFKNWSADGIYDTPSDKFKEELFFTVPDRSNNYNQLILDAEFADESEAYITGDTKVLLAMGSTQYNGNDVIMQGTVGDSVDLFTDQGAGVDYHALRTITYQWWEGDTVGEDEDALPEWATFDKSKTYTVKVTITAKGKFSDTAGVQFGPYGKFFKMKDVTRPYGGKTLTFTATPLREMNLTLPTLHDGDNLSGIEKSMNGQLMPLGYITSVRWETGTPSYAYTATTGTYYIEKLLLKPYASSTVNRPLLDNKVVIDGTWYFHAADANGNYVVVNYTSPGQRRIPIRVLPKGVSVSGQVTSYNPNNPTTVRLLQNGTEMYQTTIAVASGSGPVTQDFTFETVAEGTYDLVVTKPGHLSYTVKNVVVGSAPLDLTAQTGKPYQTITLLAGDVNGDGLIDVGDLSTVWNGANYNKSVAAASDKAADLNGDGLVDVGDLNIVWNAANYNKKADTHCVVSY